MGFPNQFFNDSWVVGIWRAGHGGNNVGLGRRAWALARAVPRALGSQVTAANVFTLREGKKESTDHHLSQACQPCATLSSISSCDRFSAARTADNGSGRDCGVN